MTGDVPHLSLESRVVASSGPIHAELDDETVILDLEAGVYYGVYGVGTRIWQLLQERRTVAEILERLVEEFDVERTRAREDLLAHLEKLAEQGLVEVER